jgi:UDP-galactopyranose mutase
MEKMINHPDIKLTLNKKFTRLTDISQYNHVFYTGPIDAFFNYEFGRLGYRTVVFDKSYANGDFQGTTQMNYCDAAVPHTRITEHKHFTPWEQHEKTICFTEYSKETTETDVPFYPKRLAADIELLKQYRNRAMEQQQVSFLGRLATYRYMDMHHVIGEALAFAQQFIDRTNQNQPAPVFSNSEHF